MAKLKLRGNMALVEQQAAARPSSQFQLAEGDSTDSPHYKVDNAGPDFAYGPGDVLMLKPVSAGVVVIDGKSYYLITNDDVLGMVAEAKKANG